MLLSRLFSGLAVAVLVGVTAVAVQAPATAHDPTTPSGLEAHRAFVADREPVSTAQSVTGAVTTCTNGRAAGYPCRNVDLLSHLSMADIGGGQGNDSWGWTDPTNRREYAIMARTNGTSFVDITDPVNPRYLGNLPTHTGTSIWRDVKVYRDHAFIVSEASGHGMQVFDLKRLRGVTAPRTWTSDVHYPGVGNSHNIAINEASGYAYLVGTQTCSGGPHMVDIRTPLSPRFVGCVSGDGYTHDTQCVIYSGPDAAYSGREICVNSNEDTVTIVDVTDKANPRQLVRKAYTGAAYTHQGWLTEDHRYFLLDDEQDETRTGVGTRTYVFDLLDLDSPQPRGVYTSTSKAIDHNLYVKGGFAYLANYQSGLRVLNLADVARGSLSEHGFFDVYPQGDAASFNGAWSNYPYFASGSIVVSSIEGGLFVLRANVGSQPADQFSLSANPQAGSVQAGRSVTATVSTQVTSGKAQAVRLTASGAPAGATVSFSPASVTSGASSTMTVATTAATRPGTYPITVTGTGPSQTRTAKYTLTVTTGTTTGCTAGNGTDVAIPDHTTVESRVTISGCTANRPAATVAVRIDHTWVGDLKVDLVAPDGSAYVLHNRADGETDNLHRTFTANVANEAPNGVWRLRVNDNGPGDIGRIDTWTLTLKGGATPPVGCATSQTVKTGTLAARQTAYQPSAIGYQAAAGLHGVCLIGPAGSDFDVYLEKRNADGTWAVVGRGETPNPNEAFTYNGTAGAYRYRVFAYSGSGSYIHGALQP